MSEYITDGAHVLIAGATGSGDAYGGKSVLANWWYERLTAQGWYSVGVYFDPKGLQFVSRQADSTVSTLQGFASAYRSGARIIQYRPTHGDEAAEHADLVELLRQLPGKKIVVHDEAQDYKTADSLAWCLSRAGNLDNADTPTDSIRSLVVTQRPWNLSEELRANMPLKVWVGPFGQEARNYFQSENMRDAADAVRDATAPYRWSVTDAGDYVETNAPVPEEYA